MSETCKAPPRRAVGDHPRFPNRKTLTATLGAVLALTLFAPQAATMAVAAPVVTAVDADRPWMNTDLSADERAALLLEAMTLEEKVDLMTGDFIAGVVGFANNGIPRLGIPALRMADAGSGLRRPAGVAPATAMPGPLAVSATWDEELGQASARVVSEEAFALRNNAVLGPNGDIARNPWFGRIGETSGEDPTLSAQMQAGIPEAAQIPGVMTVYKHPLLYSQETNRGGGTNAIADERTIREIYAPPFEAAIDGGAASLMCSFNKINGDYACESDYMQNQLMREAFGFKGFIQSDYLATHSTAPELGMDMELPAPQFYGPALLAEVQSGATPVAVIDTAVTRILWAMFETGLFDNLLPETDQPIDYPANAAVSQQVAEAAITLLSNDGVLPLSDSVDSIAVIGADTDRSSRLGGSSFVTYPSDNRGLLEGIQDQAPDGTEIRTAPGTDPLASGDGAFLGFQPISSSVQRTPDGEPGVQAEFYASNDLTGAPIVARTELDTTANIFAFNVFSDIVRTAPPGNARSLRTNSVLTVPTTGEYSFSLSGFGAGTLWIDDQQVATFDSPSFQTTATTAPITFEAGSEHTIRVEYRVTGVRVGGLERGGVQLGWDTPDGTYTPDIQAAAALAADSDVAVVYARTFEGEGMDSADLNLPRNQDDLIRAVSAANPNTVVVLGTAAPVMTPWRDQVAAVLQGYQGGQEQGDAFARVLFGAVNPSGKLPYTMADSEEQYETLGVLNPVEEDETLDVPFTEGVYLGYRGFERAGLTPAFAFGHGLSYTTFEYGDVTATPVSSDGTAPITVSFELTNTGDAAGQEVAQVYVTAPNPEGVSVKRLAGFEKVALEAGESRTVEIVIDPNGVSHPLSYWDNETHAWVTPTGTYTFSVGTASDEISASTDVVVDLGPVATTAPSIQGVVEVGERVEANPGVWDETNLRFSYQWLRDGEPIEGADSRRYSITEADAGTALSVQVTATPRNGAAGTAVSEAVTVGDGAPTATRAPSIQGTPTVGERVEANPGAWSEAIRQYSYQWLRDGVPIEGADNRRYRITEADAGTALSVQVTATPRRGLPGTAVSEAVTVDDGRPTATTAPSIEGNARVGNRLEANPGVWDQRRLTFSYQWLRDGQPIDGATGQSYRVAAADAGTALSVQVTATPRSGAAGTAVSEAVQVSVRKAPALVSVTPNSIVGDTRTNFRVTVQVRPLAAGVVAAGTVSVAVDGRTFEGTLNRNGTASIAIGRLDRGIHPIVATYSGSDTVQPATGLSLVVVRR